MPRVMYLGLQAFADEPQQLLPTAENPLACPSLVEKGQQNPLEHSGTILAEYLNNASLNQINAWLKQDAQRHITIAWPQPQPWLAASLLKGEGAQQALTNWQQQGKRLNKLFRSMRRQVTLVGYSPGQALTKVAPPQEPQAIPPVHQLAAAQLIAQYQPMHDTYEYLKASSQEQATSETDAILLATQALDEHSTLKQAEQNNVQQQKQLQDLQEESDLLLQQLHTVQEAYESLHNDKNALEKTQHTTQAAFTKLQHEHQATKTANQQNLDNLVNKLELRVAALHKTQEQLENSHQTQVHLSQQVEARQKKLNMLNETSQSHIQHLERLVQWLRVHAHRHIAAAYRNIRSYKKSLPKQAALLEASQFFDSDWYREQNPDVANANIRPAEHFIKFGALDGRDPSPLFTTSFYLTHYPDVAASGQHPLLHFLHHGITEHRQIRPEQRHLPAPAKTPGKENA